MGRYQPAGDYDKVGSQYSRTFLWTNLRFYTPFLFRDSRKSQTYLETIAGPFDAAAIAKRVVSAKS